MSFMLGLKIVNLILRFILELRTYCCRLLCYSIKGRDSGRSFAFLIELKGALAEDWSSLRQLFLMELTGAG